MANITLEKKLEEICEILFDKYKFFQEIFTSGKEISKDLIDNNINIDNFENEELVNNQILEYFRDKTEKFIKKCINEIKEEVEILSKKYNNYDIDYLLKNNENLVKKYFALMMLKHDDITYEHIGIYLDIGSRKQTIIRTLRSGIIEDYLLDRNRSIISKLIKKYQNSFNDNIDIYSVCEDLNRNLKNKLGLSEDEIEVIFENFAFEEFNRYIEKIQNLFNSKKEQFDTRKKYIDYENIRKKIKEFNKEDKTKEEIIKRDNKLYEIIETFDKDINTIKQFKTEEENEHYQEFNKELKKFLKTELDIQKF